MTQQVRAVSSGASLLPVNTALAVAMAVLLVAAVAVCYFGRLGHTRAVLLAGLRAAVQLAVVSLAIGVVVEYVPLVALFVVLMYAVAVRTSGRRLTKGPSWWWTALPIAAGVAPVLALLLATGLLPPKGISVIPIAGIFIGGALTATYLAGRRALDELTQRHGEVEAAMSLGLLDRDARLLIARDKAATALVPAIDQTRTVGLVTLPGAFVGMMLGGARPRHPPPSETTRVPNRLVGGSIGPPLGTGIGELGIAMRTDPPSSGHYRRAPAPPHPA